MSNGRAQRYSIAPHQSIHVPSHLLNYYDYFCRINWSKLENGHFSPQTLQSLHTSVRNHTFLQNFHWNITNCFDFDQKSVLIGVRTLTVHGPNLPLSPCDQRWMHKTQLALCYISLQTSQNSTNHSEMHAPGNIIQASLLLEPAVCKTKK